MTLPIRIFGIVREIGDVGGGESGPAEAAARTFYLCARCAPTAKGEDPAVELAGRDASRGYVHTAECDDCSEPFTPRFNHAYTFPFEVNTDHDTGAVTADELRAAIADRLARIPDAEVLQACGAPFDTFINEGHSEEETDAEVLTRNG